MDENVFNVDGFTFFDEESYKKARGEKKAVEYLKSQVDYTSPEAVLAVYKQIIEQDVFHTPVGNGFLAEMHRHLIENEAIDNKRIPDMPRDNEPGRTEPERKEEIKPEEKEKTKEEKRELKEPKKELRKPEKKAAVKVGELSDGKYKRRFFYSLFLNAVLIIMVIAMFVLTLTSDNPNILNYKQKLEDEYATWEQNLSNREKALNDWESDLNNRQQEENE